MPAPIALQLFTLRDALANDFDGTINKVAEIGYVGVEPAGFPGTTPTAAKKLFDDLGIEVCSAHLPMPAGDTLSLSVDTAQTLGITRIIAGLGPDHFSSPEQIRKSADCFNQAAANCVEHGLQFGIHNHWWEFVEIEGELAYKHLLRDLNPEVFFQIDAYWVQTAGADPAFVISTLAKRAPLIHLKDGPCTRKDDMLALGEGVTDFNDITAAGEESVEWWIVELDRCATDMTEAVKKSHNFLTTAGYARGR